MKELTTSELRATMVSILKEIDLFCKKNELRYCLAWGTLLGAVRHQGFIPWDDDVDIWMPRTDYERFMEEFKNDRYKVINCKTDADYPLDFSKLHDSHTIVEEEKGDGHWGVFVDIFPLDGIPSVEKGLKLSKKVRLLRRFVANQRFTYKMKLSSRNGIAKNLSIILGRVAHPFLSLNKLLLAEDDLMKKYKSQQCSYYMDLCDIGKPVLFQEVLFRNTKRLSFEGELFDAPEDYDTVLRMIFGDYMQLPPVEKRVSNHGIKAYRLFD